MDKRAAPTRKRVKHATTRGKRKTRQANMPDGWSWPPTPAMRAAGDACAELDRLGVAWKPAPRPRSTTPITVPAMVFGGVAVLPTFRKPPFVMDCQLARSLAVHGQELYARGVRELHFSRIHGYTQVRTGGTTKAALSRHARSASRSTCARSWTTPATRPSCSATTTPATHCCCASRTT